MRAAVLVSGFALAAAPLAGQAHTGPLTLPQAIELGRERGINATLARLSEQVADTRVGQRRGDLLPTVSGLARFTRQTLNLDEFGIPIATGVTDPFNIWNFRLRLTQSLFDASLLARYRAASDSATAAGLDARAAGELAGNLAGLAYLRVLATEETVRARVADSLIASSLLDQSHQLVDAGVSPAIDETRSQVSSAAVNSQLLVARNQRDRARLDLARALDLPLAQPLELTDSLGLDSLSIPLDPDAAVAFALEHRAEVAAERRRTQAVANSLHAIRYENLPSLSAVGEYGETGRQTSTLAGTYNLSLQVSVPIFDGLKRQRRAAEQSFRLEAQRVREHDLAQQVETEARQALLDVASAREQVVIAADRVRLAGQELAQSEERFQAGVAGSVETTNAQSALLQARDALIQSRVGYGLARVAAYRALGVLDQLH